MKLKNLARANELAAQIEEQIKRMDLIASWEVVKTSGKNGELNIWKDDTEAGHTIPELKQAVAAFTQSLIDVCAKRIQLIEQEIESL